tara:strand:+ start:2796 stop:3110 length:315 start_codon:yes stop_codon:yes gene_type:complete
MTKKKRKYYSPEFKEEAVTRAERGGIAKTSEELGIPSDNLRRWKREKFQKPLNPKEKPSYEDLEKENRRLKKEIGYIKDINDVLKKSTAIFSNQTMAEFRSYQR